MSGSQKELKKRRHPGSGNRRGRAQPKGRQVDAEVEEVLESVSFESGQHGVHTSGNEPLRLRLA